jgi:hypothetical protein
MYFEQCSYSFFLHRDTTKLDNVCNLITSSANESEMKIGEIFLHAFCIIVIGSGPTFTLQRSVMNDGISLRMQCFFIQISGKK